METINQRLAPNIVIIVLWRTVGDGAPDSCSRHDAMQNQAGLVPSIASPPPPAAIERETNLRKVLSFIIMEKAFTRRARSFLDESVY